MARTEFIYGKQPVAEAERGRRRRVLRVWRAPETSREELERRCGSADHQGAVAEVEPYPYEGDRELLKGEGLLIALDQIQDPRNLGAVCRSAEFAGADGVVIPDRRSAEITAVVCKTSAGAVEHLRIARTGNLADWLTAAKDAGFWIWGADAGAKQAPWDVDLKGPTVLVLGGEGKGIRPRVAKSCDDLVALPSGGTVDSLNVSAAATALLFEAVRQRS